jgi:dolichol-phosphate mannosyltransferase
MEAEGRRGVLPELRLPPKRRQRVRNWLRFGLVGASGLVVNQFLVVALTELAGIYYVLSAVLATFGSSTWNFIGAEKWAFAGRRVSQPIRNRYLGFLGLNLALLVARVPMLWALTEVLGIHYALSNLVSLAVLFVLRLAVADRWLWGDAPHQALFDAADTASITVAGEPEARHRYDVAGLLAIESDVELRELRHFASTRIGPPDIKIRVGLVAPKPTRKVTFGERDGELVYREHLGPLSANFTLRMGDPIEIKVSPILALSPHVVYTNIVEAFLRFLLVSKGYVLLHSAALVGEHGATLLSAQTDTGKTSTVISLVRSRGYRFLSDDMTIIDPRGEAIGYPKPMTLSFHTMGVAKEGRLTVGDRARLAVQSRLHSKSGRQVGRALGEKNLPIMTINSAVQFLVPPPKHRIEDLFECAVGGRAPIRNVVLMERGEDQLEPVPLDEAVRRLLENTDDAYGFPPFALFAPRIRIGGDNYAALRRKEADLLRSAISNARRWHLQVPSHEWAERLPALIDRPNLVPVGPGVPAQDDVEPVAVGPGLPALQPHALATVAGAPRMALAYMEEADPGEPSDPIQMI